MASSNMGHLFRPAHSFKAGGVVKEASAPQIRSQIEVTPSSLSKAMALRVLLLTPALAASSCLEVGMLSKEQGGPRSSGLMAELDANQCLSVSKKAMLGTNKSLASLTCPWSVAGSPHATQTPNCGVLSQAFDQFSAFPSLSPPACPHVFHKAFSCRWLPKPGLRAVSVAPRIRSAGFWRSLPARVRSGVRAPSAVMLESDE